MSGLAEGTKRVVVAGGAPDTRLAVVRLADGSVSVYSEYRIYRSREWRVDPEAGIHIAKGQISAFVRAFANAVDSPPSRGTEQQEKP